MVLHRRNMYLVMYGEERDEKGPLELPSCKPLKTSMRNTTLFSRPKVPSAQLVLRVQPTLLAFDNYDRVRNE